MQMNLLDAMTHAEALALRTRSVFCVVRNGMRRANYIVRDVRFMSEPCKIIYDTINQQVIL
jgi:hypothetical protein